MSAQEPNESLVRIAIRYFIHTAAIFAVILGIIRITPHYGAALFTEGSVLEWAHVLIMAGTACVFFFTARSFMDARELSILLGFLPLLAVSRELDNFFDALIPVLGWNAPFYLVLCLAGVHLARHRTRIIPQLRALCAHRSFALMWSGLMVAIPFAQLVGHGPFLQALFGEDYERPMKRVIEEFSETIGYLMILLAAIDWRACAARIR